jgi:hypothetical protein
MHRAFVLLVGIALTLVPFGRAAGGRAERLSASNSLLDEIDAALGTASAGAPAPAARCARRRTRSATERFDNWIGDCRTDDPVCSLTLNRRP